MELCQVHLIFFIIIFSTLTTFTWGASINSVDSIDDEILLKWTTNAMKFFDFNRCLQVNIGDNTDCYKLSQVSRSSINVYVGRAKVDHNDDSTTFLYQSVGKGGGGHGRKKVYAILPDSINQKESKAHDVVLALDPYPSTNFGHLIGLFYVDVGVEDRFCQENHQIMIADQTCITVAKKTRCPNLLERTASFLPRRCHIDFLPTVHLAGLNHGTILSGKGDLLECVRISGFATCPKLRTSDIETASYQPATTNSRRLQSSLLSTCKLFQTCDRGILVGGGWSRVHSTQSLSHILKMDEMLQRNGFASDNIKMFYANGASHGESSNRLISPSTMDMKSGLRSHLRSICEARHCADTLFIYLNNPTTVEGDMLLWDLDNNGIADEMETYKIKEFLSDLSRCEAKRIIIVADQSNSDILVNLLKQSSDHPNAIVFGVGQTSINGELTDIWTNHSHPTSCLSHLHDTCSMKMKDSTAMVYDSSFGNLLKISIVGAPCDLSPALSPRELRSLYQGCQNVPTSVWFSMTDEDDDDGDEDGESDENSSDNNRRML